MQHPVLGRLERVGFETVSRIEQCGFADWFAEPRRLKRLGETLGFDLEPPDAEPDSGPDRAGLLCRDAESGSVVAIEAQLGESLHARLGGLLVRATESGADTAVWLAERFNHEHRVAVEGLNRGAGGSEAFFAVEIGLWRIDASRPALRFEPVAWPKGWPGPRRESEAEPREPRRAPLPGSPPPRRVSPSSAPRRRTAAGD